MPGLETGRHRLPLMATAQAQKEVTHNEALVLIDALLHTAVEGILTVAPAPGDGDIGKCWLIGSASSGKWANRSGHLAIWVGGSWRFAAPENGMRIWVKSVGNQSQHINGQWVQAPSISAPAGGAVVDVEGRATLAAILQYLRSVGILAT